MDVREGAVFVSSIAVPSCPVPNLNEISQSPRNSVRCFLTAATLDCFARSNVTLLLCLSKAESAPLLLTTPDAAMLFFGF